MVSACATRDERGLLTEITLNIGTGGHGDTSDAYHKTYREIVSMVNIPFTIKTGERDKKGKLIYKTEYKEEKRVNSICDIEGINPTIYMEFMKVFDINRKSAVNCYDLIDTIEDKKGVRDFKVGVSFVCGKYKAVLIRKKVQFYLGSKPVRTFKGK
tara:strand:- start:548 stop:1015 length:468 start_codon:yes stop_codon:yes gene_type:complete